MKCGTAILAAGMSQRMGRPKSLLPWGDASIMGHLVALYAGLVEQVVVVCRPGDEPLNRELDRLALPPSHRIPNPETGSDMFASVRLALGWTGWNRDLTHLLLALGDQPQIEPATITRLLDAARTAPDRIIQPFQAGRRRHPVILPVPLARSIALDSRFTTLRDALNEYRDKITPLPVNDPGLDTDLDSPADYQTAVKRFAPHAPPAKSNPIQPGQKIKHDSPSGTRTQRRMQ